LTPVSQEPRVEGTQINPSVNQRVRCHRPHDAVQRLPSTKINIVFCVYNFESGRFLILIPIFA
jgi:hypothetical protein